MKGLATGLALLSGLLFVVSLWLPAASLESHEFLGWRFDIHGVVMGWEAAWGTINLSEGLPHDREGLALLVHGLTNLLLLVGLFVVLCRRSSAPRWLPHLMLAATLYNAGAGWELDVTVQLGFYVWLAAFVTTTIALYARTNAPATGPTAPSDYGLETP